MLTGRCRGRPTEWPAADSSANRLPPISAALAETMFLASPQSAFASAAGPVRTPCTGQNDGERSPDSVTSRPVAARTWSVARSRISLAEFGICRLADSLPLERFVAERVHFATRKSLLTNKLEAFR